MNRTERRRQAKLAKRRHYEVSAPMLVVRTLENTDMETRERMAVTAFSSGFANTKHFDVLVEMIGMRDRPRRSGRGRIALDNSPMVL